LTVDEVRMRSGSGMSLRVASGAAATALSCLTVLLEPSIGFARRIGIPRLGDSSAICLNAAAMGGIA
jgi:hypothetical protein